MKWYNLVFFLIGIGGMTSACWAAGFWKAESFPATFQDLSFENRMNVLADGYDGFETKFDSNGVCISGCPYRGITVKQMQQMSNQNTIAGNAYILNQIHNMQTVPPRTQSETHPSVSADTSPNLAVYQPAEQRVCKHHSDIVDFSNSVPVQAPLDGKLIVTSDFGPRKAPTDGASTWHSGIDLSAPKGTPVYAPAMGRVSGTPGGACGLGLEIDHGNGFVTKYCHLNERGVNVGDTIQSGCQIGTVGNTGGSTGPHLHYAIMYNNQPFDPLYRENRLGRSYSMTDMSPGRENGVILPGRI